MNIYKKAILDSTKYAFDKNKHILRVLDYCYDKCNNDIGQILMIYGNDNYVAIKIGNTTKLMNTQDIEYMTKEEAIMYKLSI